MVVGLVDVDLLVGDGLVGELSRFSLDILGTTESVLLPPPS